MGDNRTEVQRAVDELLECDPHVWPWDVVDGACFACLYQQPDHGPQCRWVALDEAREKEVSGG